MSRRIAGIIAFILIVAPVSYAGAATITVNSSSTGSNVMTGCALRDAIQAVNTLAPVGKCPAGEGGNVVNTINIDVNALSFSEVDAHSIGAVLPAIVAGRVLNIYGRPDTRTLLSLNITCGPLNPFYARLLEINAGAAVLISDVDFANGCPSSGDTLGGAGGGIANLGTLYLTRSRLNANGLIGTGFGSFVFLHGAAVYNGPDAQFSASAVTFDSNFGDGALYIDVDADQGFASVDASTFVGNYLDGIVNAGAVVVTNSTFVGNYGAIGFGPTLPASAITNLTGATLSLSFLSIEDNLAGSQIDIATGSSAWIGSSLFLTKGMIPNCMIEIGASVSWYGSSISSDATCAGGANLVNTDPRIDSALADNGGPTQTLRLLAGSPAFHRAGDCIDVAGDPVATDQRGTPRPQRHCDAGAYNDTLFFHGFDD